MDLTYIFSYYNVYETVSTIASWVLLIGIPILVIFPFAARKSIAQARLRKREERKTPQEKLAERNKTIIQDYRYQHKLDMKVFVFDKDYFYGFDELSPKDITRLFGDYFAKTLGSELGENGLTVRPEIQNAEAIKNLVSFPFYIKEDPADPMLLNKYRGLIGASENDGRFFRKMNKNDTEKLSYVELLGSSLLMPLIKFKNNFNERFEGRFEICFMHFDCGYDEIYKFTYSEIDSAGKKDDKHFLDGEKTYFG